MQGGLIVALADETIAHAMMTQVSIYRVSATFMLLKKN